MNDYTYAESLPSRVTALEEELNKQQKQIDYLSTTLKNALDAQDALIRWGRKIERTLTGDGR